MTADKVASKQINSTANAPAQRDPGVIEIPAFELPPSALLDTATHRRLQGWADWVKTLGQPPGHWTDADVIPALRKYYDDNFYAATIAATKARYPVHIEPATVGDVYAEVFTPDDGVAAHNRNRVLINLHGGGFTVGARTGGQLESIPVAALGRIKVISIDYRMAPEFQFPAATADVVTVYRQLLHEYAAPQIGIFGCSAGAVLTAQVTAQLHCEGCPMPGALGMFCGAGHGTEGDSAHMGAARLGTPLKPLQTHPYFENANLADPRVAPSRSPEVLSNFPPSLFITSTRDQVMSSVVYMHSRLVALGVAAELHVWEGLDHAFFYDPELRQSLDAYRVAVKFFERHLEEGRYIANDGQS